MKNKIRIAILLPTRGLIFGQTLKSLFDNLRGVGYKMIIVSGKPIPDAQNLLVKKALTSNCSHMLFVEEDMYIPTGTVKRMLKMDKNIVCVDYPVISGWSTIKKKNGEIKHCGLGCTLIKRRVFEKIKRPWFVTHQSLDAKTGEVLDIPMKYGGHDIFFGIKVREAGFKIHQLGGVECEHLRCSDLNRREYNDATYEIYSLPKISRWQED